MQTVPLRPIIVWAPFIPLFLTSTLIFLIECYNFVCVHCWSRSNVFLSSVRSCAVKIKYNLLIICLYICLYSDSQVVTQIAIH